MIFLRSKILCSYAQKHDVPALKNIVFLRSTALKNLTFLRSKLQGAPRIFLFPVFTHLSFGYYSNKISRKRNCNKEREKEKKLKDTATSCMKLHAEVCLTM
jgi:hypothetical protein